MFSNVVEHNIITSGNDLQGIFIALDNKSSADGILSRILAAYGIDKKWGWKSVLAAALGLTQPTVSSWDKRGVPEAIITKISREKNIPVRYLETGEGPNTFISYSSVDELPEEFKQLLDGQLDYKLENGLSDDALLLVQMFEKMTDEQKADLIKQAAAIVISNMD